MESERNKYARDDFPPSKLEKNPATGMYKDIPARVRELYSQNCFMKDFFHVNIDYIRCGECQVSLFIEHAKHSNHRNVVHGGVLAALADSVLGVTGASVGEKVVTVNFSMNYIRNIDFGDTARMTGRVAGRNGDIMTITGEMYDSEDRLMATLVTTMMCVGKFEGIPEKWESTSK